MNEKIELKKQLLKKCIELLEKEIMETKKAMDEAQEEANSHKGAMESRYDTFKEEAQYKAGAYGKKLLQLKQQLNQILLIKPNIHTTAQLGSVVEVDDVKYFMVGYLGPEPIKIDNESFLPISISSPAGKSFLNKKAGDIISINNKQIKIKNVY